MNPQLLAALHALTLAVGSHSRLLTANTAILSTSIANLSQSLGQHKSILSANTSMISTMNATMAKHGGRGGHGRGRGRRQRATLFNRGLARMGIHNPLAGFAQNIRNKFRGGRMIGRSMFGKGLGGKLAGGAIGGVGAFITLGIAAIRAAQAIDKWASDVLEANKKYANASPAMAMVFAQASLQEYFRNMRKGAELAPSARELSRADQRDKEAWSNADVWWQKQKNRVAAGWKDLSASVGEATSGWFGESPSEKRRKNEESMAAMMKQANETAKQSGQSLISIIRQLEILNRVATQQGFTGSDIVQSMGQISDQNGRVRDAMHRIRELRKRTAQ